MKILLDKCINRKLAYELKGEHVVKTVPQMGWATIKNGKLLTLAEIQFDVFMTVNHHFSFQQNLLHHIAVLVLHAQSNRLADLKPLVPQILSKLPQLIKGKAESVKQA